MKNPRPVDETCETCVYWQIINAEKKSKAGECRVDPPVLFDDGETGWPRTSTFNWCGVYNNDWHNRFRKDSPEEMPHHGLERTGLPEYGARGAE